MLAKVTDVDLRVIVAVPAVPSDQIATSLVPFEDRTTLLPRTAPIPTLPIFVVTVSDSPAAAPAAFFSRV